MIETFQQRAQQWAEETFGDDARNSRERGCRLIEETAELTQVMGVSKDILHQIIDHVYSRPYGILAYEIADVAIILSGIAQMYGVNLTAMAEDRLKVCIAYTDEIRAKHASKIR